MSCGTQRSGVDVFLDQRCREEQGQLCVLWKSHDRMTYIVLPTVQVLEESVANLKEKVESIDRKTILGLYETKNQGPWLFFHLSGSSE